MTTLARFLQRLESRGAEKCLHGEGRWHTYGELLSRVAVWQRQLQDSPANSGSVLALQADYSLDSIAFLLAAWANRLIVALVPRGADPAPYLAASRANHAVELSSSGTPTWTEPPPPADEHPLIRELSAAGDGGIVIFTSGSTGRPKAALHSVERFLRKFDHSRRGLRTLAFLQFDHVAGLDTLLYTLAAGGALVLLPDRNPATVCALIETAGVEVLSTSPSFLRLLWASEAADNHDLSSLKIVTYGSEPMDAATLERVNEMFPGVWIRQKYGTTETGAPRTLSRSNDSLWMKIDSDTVETDIRDGILWIRSADQFLGYLNAPHPFDEAGWYCTGDRVAQQGEWIHVLGRESDLINVGGEKVSPVEVEQVILELDEVVSVAVTGAPHGLIGHIVTAVVQLRPDVDPQLAEALVRRHCRNRLPRYMVPVSVEVTTDSLSSDRQKIRRRR